MSSRLIDCQEAVAEHLEGVAELANVAVIAERLRELEGQALMERLPWHGVTGKDEGMVIVVMAPLGNILDPLSGGAIDEVKLVVRVMENPIVHLTRGTEGHPDAWEAAEIVLGEVAQLEVEPYDLVFAVDYPSLTFGNDPYRIGAASYTNWERWAKRVRPQGDMESCLVLDAHFTTVAAPNIPGRTVAKMALY